MKKIVTNFIILLLLGGFILGKEDNPTKIGLVLSGGGIKGFGHLGTLYLLDSLNIPIDMIIGTSIGAISAALYATGHSPEEIDKIATNTKWDEIFSQSPKRNKLNFFQKMDDDKFQLLFSLRGFKPTVPISLSNGQYTYEHLLDIFKNYTYTDNYDNFVIPFRCNATDIIDGKEIIFNQGSIAKSLRISSSIPTIFSPIEKDNNLLVDGGIINNFPANIAEDLGADFIIGIDVTSPNKSKEEIIDIFSIVEKIIDLYGYKNKKTNILKTDILINPKFKNISSIDSDPNIILKIKEQGKKTAYKYLNDFLELKQNMHSNYSDNNYVKLSSIKENSFKINSVIFSEDIRKDSLFNSLFFNDSILSKNDFIDKISKIRSSNKYHNIHYKFKKHNLDNSFILYLNAVKTEPLKIKKIKIKGNHKISANEIKAMFSAKENKNLNSSKLNNEIKKAYKTGYFDYINYDLIKTNNNSINLIINVKETENKKLKLGAIWDNHYKLIGKFKLDILNKPFNKFRIHNEILFSGFKQNKFTLYYLMMNNNMINLIPFFEITNRIKEIGVKILDDNISYIKHDFINYGYGLILPLKEFGSVSISINRLDSKYSSDNFNLKYDNVNYANLIFNIDQLDDLLNPKNGYNLLIDYQNKDNSDGDISKYHHLNSKFEYFKTFNNIHTFRLYNWHKKTSTSAPLYLNSNFGGYNWAVGYNEFILSSLNLTLSGFEYQFHYKNSTTIRVIFNKIIEIDSIKNCPITYGLGIKIKSIVGPINFTWGRGYKEPFNKNSAKNDIFYFNFGVEL